MFLVGKFKYFCRLFADLIENLCKRIKFFKNNKTTIEYCKSAIYGILVQLSRPQKLYRFGSQPDHMRHDAPDHPVRRFLYRDCHDGSLLTEWKLRHKKRQAEPGASCTAM